MRIGILGAANSVHIIRIANGLIGEGHNVIVCSLPEHSDNNNLIKGKVVYLKHGGQKGYFLNWREVRKIAKKEKFDVLNVHYASGYGCLGRLADIKPWVLSVWGSDIYEFPKQGILKRHIVKRNLDSADAIFSTSHCMKNEIEKYLLTQKSIRVTPFGVDLNLFVPSKILRNKESGITIGFFKGTDFIYGIDLFLDVALELKKRMDIKKIPLHIKICGQGSRFDFIKNKIKDMKIDDMIEMAGSVPHSEMVKHMQECDIACIPSIAESFGVVAIEAMACGIPCVTSNAQGLEEVMKDGSTGYVMNTNSYMDYADKIDFLIDNIELRTTMGNNARCHVEKEYDFKQNIKEFLKGFEQIM